MRKTLAAVMMLALPSAASAYLSQDGKQLANGRGRCVTCNSGWQIDPATGYYYCRTDHWITEPCNPAKVALPSGPLGLKPRKLQLFAGDGSPAATATKVETRD